MFIINSVPISNQRSFSDYAEFLFDRWVIRSHKVYKATEVHLIFDDPNRHGISPKDLERSRRDTISQESTIVQICPDTPLPSNWHNFIAVRSQKRLLINFLSDHFLLLANQKFKFSECFFITAGGFDNQYRDQARCAVDGSSAEYVNATAAHEEADTRVWLHAAASTAEKIFIYSPDTDVSFIGLPLMKKLNKTVFVQLKDSPYESLYLDMNKLVQFLHTDLHFQGLHNIEECILMLYILSGCDFVSFFRGYGKKTFFEVFRKYADFITGSHNMGNLTEIEEYGGLHAFYRLITSVYFHKYCSAFQPLSTPKALFDSVDANDEHQQHLNLISDIREKQWERVVSETEIIPNHEALRLLVKDAVLYISTGHKL